MHINNYVNANGLNVQSKYQITEWIKKPRPIYLLPVSYFRPKDTHRLKLKGWKNIYLENRDEKLVLQYLQQNRL